MVWGLGFRVFKTSFFQDFMLLVCCNFLFLDISDLKLQANLLKIRLRSFLGKIKSYREKGLDLSYAPCLTCAKQFI